MIMIYRRKWSNPTQDPTISNKQVTYTSTRSGGRKGISTVVTWLRDGIGVWLGDWSGKDRRRRRGVGQSGNSIGGWEEGLGSFVTWSRSFVVCIRTRLFFYFFERRYFANIMYLALTFFKKNLA